MVMSPAVAGAVVSQSVSADVRSPESEAVAFDDPVVEAPLDAVTTDARQPVSADVDMSVATVVSNVSHSIATSFFYRRSAGMCKFFGRPTIYRQLSPSYVFLGICRFLY